MIAFLYEPRYLSRPSLRISQRNCRICDSEIATQDNLLTSNDKVNSTKDIQLNFSFPASMNNVVLKKRSLFNPSTISKNLEKRRKRNSIRSRNYIEVI